MEKQPESHFDFWGTLLQSHDTIFHPEKR